MRAATESGESGRIISNFPRALGIAGMVGTTVGDGPDAGNQPGVTNSNTADDGVEGYTKQLLRDFDSPPAAIPADPTATATATGMSTELPALPNMASAGNGTISVTDALLMSQLLLNIINQLEASGSNTVAVGN